MSWFIDLFFPTKMHYWAAYYNDFVESVTTHQTWVSNTLFFHLSKDSLSKAHSFTKFLCAYNTSTKHTTLSTKHIHLKHIHLITFHHSLTGFHIFHHGRQHTKHDLINLHSSDQPSKHAHYIYIHRYHYIHRSDTELRSLKSPRIPFPTYIRTVRYVGLHTLQLDFRYLSQKTHAQTHAWCTLCYSQCSIKTFFIFFKSRHDPNFVLTALCIC